MFSLDHVPTGRAATAAELAASLRELADKLATLGAMPVGYPAVTVHIQPYGDSDAGTVAVIDRFGMALSGRPGTTEQMSSGSFHHAVRATVSGIRVSVFNEVASPEQRELRAEIERLRALLPSEERSEKVSRAGMVNA